MSKIDDSGYPKTGAKIIGYRYSVSDNSDSGGFWRATLEMRRFHSCDMVRVIAEELRSGQNAECSQRRLEKIREAGSGAGRYFAEEYCFSSEECIAFACQANLADYKPEDTFQWYGMRCESSGISKWSAKMLRFAADACPDPISATPRMLVDAIGGIPVRYVESGVWVIDTDPGYTDRQWEYAQREAPESADEKPDESTESFATQCLDDPQAHESAPLGSVGVA